MPVRKKPRLLLFTRDASRRHLVELLLARRGYTVLAVGDSRSALANVLANQADILLADEAIGLPSQSVPFVNLGSNARQMLIELEEAEHALVLAPPGPAQSEKARGRPGPDSPAPTLQELAAKADRARGLGLLQSFEKWSGRYRLRTPSAEYTLSAGDASRLLDKLLGEHGRAEPPP